MKIKKHLVEIRNIRIFHDLTIFFLYFLITTIFILLLGLLLESIFYFSPEIKNGILWLLVGTIIIMFLWFTITAIRVQTNSYNRYSWETLAHLIGQSGFLKKSDTVINAFQLEKDPDNNQSKDLANSFISKVSNTLNNVNISEILDSNHLFRVKKWTVGIMFLSIMVFFVYRQQNADAFYRWKHYEKQFSAPKPFKLLSLSGNQHILGGEKTSVTFQAKLAEPDSVFLRLRPTQTAIQKRDSLTLIFSEKRNPRGLYNFELPELFQDYAYEAVVKAEYFWEAWGEVKSYPDTIYVTDRPALGSFRITVIPPLYSNLNAESQDGSVAAVQGLKGSVIQINLESNRVLKSSFLTINDSLKVLSTFGKKASGNFILNEMGKFSVHLVDTRGITNRDPVSYHLHVIPDHKPILNILEPPPIIVLGSNQIIPFNLEIEDDYGFTSLQVAYEVRRPEFLQIEPYIAMFSIPELDTEKRTQIINSHWNLSNLMLMPEDEVHYHFEIDDNDAVSGPKKTVSGIFIARLPSLGDLYQTLENDEQKVDKEFITSIENIKSLKNRIEDMKLDVLKTEELEWEDQQEINQIINKAKEELETLEKISESFERMTKDGEKHELFLPELMKKFKELSKLIQKLIPENLLKNMTSAQNAIDNMDMKSLQEALDNMTQNMDQIEDELDRYLDIFRRLQAEQKLDEIKTRLEQLVQHQDGLDREISDINNETDKSTLSRLSQEEQRNLEEFNTLKEIMNDAAALVKPFSESTSRNLQELKNSPVTENTGEDLEETVNNLQQTNSDLAIESSGRSLNNLLTLQQKMMEIQQQFQQETVAEMTEKFEKLMRDILFLSKQEEELRSDVKSASRTSPRLRNMAAKQQLLQDQLKQIMNQMMDLSRKTFAITPMMGKAMGGANASMDEAKTNLTNRQITQATRNQATAMQGLNQAALTLFQSIQQMQSSGSASGYEQFLQMMQQMAGQQQGLNQQGMQIAFGQLAASAHQQLMQQMLQGQEQVHKSLQQLIQEMKQSGKQGLGDLSGIEKDIEDVITDLQQSRFTRKTQNRQQRILSRMLDSQTSLTQRGFKDERTSTTADITMRFIGPGGLPADRGQRKNLALDAMNRSLNAGYSREYQTMIKRYFNTMSQLGVETSEQTDELPTP